MHLTLQRWTTSGSLVFFQILGVGDLPREASTHEADALPRLHPTGRHGLRQPETDVQHSQDPRLRRHGHTHETNVRKRAHIHERLRLGSLPGRDAEAALRDGPGRAHHTSDAAADVSAVHGYAPHSKLQRRFRGPGTPGHRLRETRGTLRLSVSCFSLRGIFTSVCVRV